MLIDINGPPNPPGFIGYPPPPLPQTSSMPPPSVKPFNYQYVCINLIRYVVCFFIGLYRIFYFLLIKTQL